MIPKKNDLVTFLKRVNYYRLTFYLFPYRVNNSNYYKKGTSLSDIIRIYEFDNKLRNLTLLYMSDIESSILHSVMVENCTRKYKPFGYLDVNNFHSKVNRRDYNRCIGNIKTSAERSEEEFVEHFRQKYTSERNMPMWMVVETCSFGTLSHLFSMMKLKDQQDISDIFNVTNRMMRSWLHSLSYVRNLCAHHARYYNRTLGVRPSVPRRIKLPEYFDPFTPRNDRIFSVFTIMKYLLDQLSLGEQFKTGLVRLLGEYPEIDLEFSGFEENWQDHKLWQ